MPQRSVARRLAHLLERAGLALAGAAGGLFVGAYVGGAIAALTTQGFLIAMMSAGAAGFYLGIDTPPHRFRGVTLGFAGGARAGRLDAAELLTALGTFFAALTAFVSVALILFGVETQLGWTVAIMTGWVAGVLMQITAGAIARIQA